MTLSGIASKLVTSPAPAAPCPALPPGSLPATDIDPSEFAPASPMRAPPAPALPAAEAELGTESSEHAAVPSDRQSTSRRQQSPAKDRAVDPTTCPTVAALRRPSNDWVRPAARRNVPLVTSRA